MPLSVRRVEAEEFGRLQGAWSDLLSRAPGAGPMLTWEWTYSWWEAYRNWKAARALYVLAAYRDGLLEGVAPLVLRPWREAGLSFRRLEFMGTGEPEADETCSEFLDVVAAADAEEEVAEAFAEHLLRDAAWDELVLRDVRADEPTGAARLQAALQRRGKVAAESFGHARCPYIPLPASWDAYLAGLSRNSRRIIRYKRRQLLAAAAAEFVSVERADELQAVFPRFASLHRERWQAEHRAGCLASPVFGEFLAKVSGRLAEAGRLRISYLTLNGEMAAAYYLLKHGDRLYYYNSGMAVDRFGEHSPGSVCLGFIIEEAIRQGLREFHFMKGGADSYKFHWTSSVVPVLSLRVRRRGWKGAAGSLAAAPVRVAKAIARRMAARCKETADGGDSADCEG
jgi:CelD/BcsL family acetyltransferase involved in cellulose biosynthesis